MLDPSRTHPALIPARCCAISINWWELLSVCVGGVSISRSPDLLISPATHPATPPLTRHTKRLSRRAATLPFIYTTHPFASKPEMPLSCTHNAKHDVPLNVGPKQLNRQTGQSIGPERHPKIENHSHSRNDIVTPPVPAGLKGHDHSSVQRRDTHICTSPTLHVASVRSVTMTSRKPKLSCPQASGPSR